MSPDPLTTFVGKRVPSDVLFEVPIRLIGSPGSGKTMMASLVEFRLVETVLRDQSSESSRALAGALASCGLTDGDRPSAAAVRLPMESEYRDFWELPYDGLVKTRLITSLLQARTVLGLFRNLCSDRRRRPEQIRFIAREGAEAQLDQIGGLDPIAVRDRARAVERAVYTVGASLIPPALDEIPPDARDPYQPFEAIREIEIDWEGEPIRLRPLVVLDDVHTLHPKQFDALLRVLARREMKFGRWMMMRLDALTPGTVFRSDEDALPGLKRGRDYVDVFMQSPERGDDRLLFRRMATDMADRYLRLVQPLRDRGVTNFRRLLATEPPRLTRSKLAEVRRLVDQDQRNLGVATARREKIEELVESYAKGAKGTRAADVVEEVRLGMTRVLLHRYTKRIARQLPGLFENEDPEPLKPLKADADVAEAARSLLHRKFQRPFHYGLDDLCDASNENAEVFLHLAGALVSRMETRVIRGLDPVLGPGLQEGELLHKSRELIQDWRFPFADKVRGLVKAIAQQCEKASDLDNARYGAGVNAVAVPELEMPELLSGAHELATVLKFAVAYAAIVAVRDYGQGGKHWCLLELSGPVCLAHGLTLHRGGFLERRVADLKAMVDTV